MSPVSSITPTCVPLEFDEFYYSETEGYLKPHGAAWELVCQAESILRNDLFTKTQLQKEDPASGRVYLKKQDHDIAPSEREMLSVSLLNNLTLPDVPPSWKTHIQGVTISVVDFGIDGNHFVIRGPVIYFRGIGEYQVNICVASLDSQTMISVREKNLDEAVVDYLRMKIAQPPGYAGGLTELKWLKNDLDRL